MAQKQTQQPGGPADQFSDEEMEQVKRYGQALGGGPTPFDEEVQRGLDRHAERAQEANAAKMHAAQTGGDTGLGPSEMDQAAVKQSGALQQQADVSGAQQAQQAQTQQSPPAPPPAPPPPSQSRPRSTTDRILETCGFPRDR